MAVRGPLQNGAWWAEGQRRSWGLGQTSQTTLQRGSFSPGPFGAAEEQDRWVWDEASGRRKAEGGSG